MRRLLAVLAVGAVVITTQVVSADEIYWQDGINSWFNAPSWIDYSQTDQNGNYINQVPGGADDVYIENGGTAQIFGGATAYFLGVDFGSACAQSAGGLSVSTFEFLGGVGSGTFNNSGGTNTCGFLDVAGNPGSAGTYNLSGTGSLSVDYGNEEVGDSGTGIFNQTGGTNTTAGALQLSSAAGSIGTYTMSAGLLSAGDEFVGDGGGGGTGTFNQSGGTNTVGTLFGLLVSSSGGSTYTLSGTGSLSVSGNEYVGDSGVGNFVQTGGTNSMTTANGSLRVGNDAGSIGAYSLSGMGTVSANWESIGYQGTGRFNQTGGTNTVSIGLYVGDNVAGANGTYSLSGSGTLSAAAEYIGNLGTGTFTQEAGTNTLTGSLTVGYIAGAGGSYLLYGGTLAVADYEDIGSYGTGTFTQTGGTNSMTGAKGFLRVGIGGGSTGIYSLSGTGTVSASYESIGYQGTGNFNQTGGTNTVSIGLYVGDNVGGANGTYSLSGSGALSAATEYIGNLGAGAFSQSGGTNTVTGTLTLAANAGSSGAYNLQGGTLTAGAVNVNSGGTFNVTGGNLSASGGMTISSSGVVAINSGDVSTASVSSDGSITISGGTFSTTGNEIDGNTGSGQITQTGGNHTVTGTLTLAANPGSSGTYNMQGGTLNAELIEVNSGGTFSANAGAGSVTSTVGLFVGSGGTLNGSGRLSADVNSSGVVAPGGANPSTLTIDGNYTQNTNGTLTVAINGATNASSSLDVVGTASLSGKLTIPLLGNTIPSNNTSYQVLTAGSLGGTFANTANQLVEAKFTNGANPLNNNSAGLFSVSYANNAVTLSNFHQVHVLSVGVTDSGVPIVENGVTSYGSSILGDSAAGAVSTALGSLPGVVADTPLSLTAAYGANNSENVALLESAIADENVHPGDTFIFYINAHANPNGPPWSSPSTNINGVTNLSLGSSVTNKGETIDAATFAGLFSGAKWNDVNKLFVMDTCSSMGFWEGSDPAELYLSGLPKSAIIAACPEGQESAWHSPFPDGYSGGDLGHAFVEAINDLNTTGGTFNVTQLESLTYFEEQQDDAYWQSEGLPDSDNYQYDANGFAEGGSAGVYGQPLPNLLPDSVTGGATSDFQLGLMGIVPEPASITMVVGILGFALARRRRRVDPLRATYIDN
jgi:hypothetical protein